jgi:hypothetical protein
MNLVKTAICRAKADKTRNNSWGSGNSLARISGLFRQVAEQCKRLPQVSLLLILVALSPNCYNIIKFEIIIISVLVQKLRYFCFHALSFVRISISEKMNKPHLISLQKIRKGCPSKARHIPRLRILPLPLCR